MDWFPNWERSTSRLYIVTLPIASCCASLDETPARVKIARRNINNFRYEDDITLMAKTEEELKSLLMKSKSRVKKLA